MIDGEDVLASVDDERGGAGHRGNHPLDTRSHRALGGGTTPPRALVVGGAREVEEMHSLGIVQPQCAGDGFEDPLGGARQIAALHPVVVVDADPGERCHLLASQPRHPPPPVGGQPHHLGRELRAARGQEIADLGPCLHIHESRDDTAV
jgi:hypothetical protein